MMGMENCSSKFTQLCSLLSRENKTWKFCNKRSCSKQRTNWSKENCQGSARCSVRSGALKATLLSNINWLFAPNILCLDQLGDWSLVISLNRCNLSPFSRDPAGLEVTAWLSCSSAKPRDQSALGMAHWKPGILCLFTESWPCHSTAIAMDHPLLWNFMPKCKIAEQFTNISACHSPSPGLVSKLSGQMVSSKSTATASGAGSLQWFLTVDNLRELYTTSLNQCRL